MVASTAGAPRRFCPARRRCAGDDPGWFRRVHEAFHDVTRDLARPAFLDTRDDPWTYGERVAWEGESPEGHAETLSLLTRAIARLEPVDVRDQVVHGDLGGNVLRDGDRAAVIDWPPYWRPADWALAVVATDAVCWEGADESSARPLVDGGAVAAAAAPGRDLPPGHPRPQPGARARTGRQRRVRRRRGPPALPDRGAAAVSDHYFSADPSVPFEREPVSCEVWGQRLDLVSGSGVYSRGRLDIGTAVLFRETDAARAGPGARPRHRLRRHRARRRRGLASRAASRSRPVP